MKVIYGISNIKKQAYPSVVSVGVFDGVHIGHQKVIKGLIKNSRALKAKAVIVTFSPHPAKVLEGEAAIAMLASLKHRLSLLESFGVELCVVVNFDRNFAQKSALDFIKRFLIDKLNMKAFVIGENFSLGREKLRSISALRGISRNLNFKLCIISPKRYHSRVISSSLIRHLIENGRLSQASKLLARPVSILGTVVKGKQRGRSLGFKTANIDPHHEAIPPSGVYACYSKLGAKLYKSVLNIGTRPTFNEKEPTIEVHLFNFKGNLYGKDIEIDFLKRLRAEKKFKNKDHLRSQIIKDASMAGTLL